MIASKLLDIYRSIYSQHAAYLSVDGLTAIRRQQPGGCAALLTPASIHNFWVYLRVQRQVVVQRKHLQDPNRRGRRALLLKHLEIAIPAAIMHVQYGTTALDIGRLAGHPAISLTT